MNKSAVIIASILFCVATLSHADYEAGVEAAQQGDYATALREFTLAAESGMVMAQYNLAILYFAGQGTDQDYAKALKWSAAAAEQGHVAAQFNLGALYYEGNGARKNMETAFEWYSKAADADHAAAQYNVAEMYYLGDGVDKNLVLAHAWASRAIDNDDALASKLRDDIAEDLDAEELAEARRVFARMKIGL
ncbi:MAG: sel1 repeat family protein [Gammaproteobacteria bacterium]|nr:sel1 repeat family protein [Gammaproteobacteria bacterium]